MYLNYSRIRHHRMNLRDGQGALVITWGYCPKHHEIEIVKVSSQEGYREYFKFIFFYLKTYLILHDTYTQIYGFFLQNHMYKDIQLYIAGEMCEFLQGITSPAQTPSQGILIYQFIIFYFILFIFCFFWRHRLISSLHYKACLVCIKQQRKGI